MPTPDSGASEEARQRLEATILGAPTDLSADDVRDAARVEPHVADRFWRALGFAGPDPDATFSGADADAMKLVASMLRGGELDEETLVRLTRAVGQTMARLADWEVATLAERIEHLEAGPDATGSRLERANRYIGDIGPVFEQLLIYAWRRHLAAAVLRVEAMGAADNDLHNAELTVGFSDLVGFSAYSNEHSQDEIAEVVEEFENRCFDAVAHHGGRVIKTLGDSVLFVCVTAEEAYDVAADIVHDIGDDDDLPDVRIGLATGNVILRRGDVFGPAVNLAARLVNVARRNRIIVDDTTAERLPDDRFESRRLPARPIHGFGDLEPVAVRRRPSA